MSTLVGLMSYMGLHSNIAYLILFLGSYFDTLFPMGFFVYGEIFFLAGAILAGLGYLNIWLVLIVCLVGGVIGDSSSYLVGRLYGQKITRMIFKKGNTHLNPKNYEKATHFFHRHGKKSIFFARLLGPLSWVTPFIAGTFNIKYKDFLKYDILGVTVGIGQFIAAGYFFGFAYTQLLQEIQKYFLIALLILFFVAVYLFEKKFNLFGKAMKHLVR